MTVPEALRAGQLVHVSKHSPDRTESFDVMPAASKAGSRESSSPGVVWRQPRDFRSLPGSVRTASRRAPAQMPVNEEGFFRRRASSSPAGLPARQYC